MNNFLLFSLALALNACGVKQEETSKNNFFEVNTTNSLLDIQKELTLSELADSVWYVPLETTDKLLLGNVLNEGYCKYVGNQFYIYDGQQNAIYVFSSDGKFKNKIGKKGQGADEISQFLDFTTDEELVYVADFGNRLHRFKNDGTNLGNTKLPKQAYKLMSVRKNELACFISDNQFDNTDDAYSWLMVNSEGDFVSYRKTPSIRVPDKGNTSNHYVLHDFSTEFPSAYKEAYNDTLYYFTSSGNVCAYGFINLGIHKADPLLSFDELIKQKHAMRLAKIYDTPYYIIGRGTCICIKNEQKWFVWNKNTGDFFHLNDSEEKSNITNDLGGPDFKPFCCAYPNLLIGIVDPIDCSDIFMKQYNITPDDNPVLVMVKCKS